MDEMPSSEFRRRYATLTKPTTVTVNGHGIGEWHPYLSLKDFTRDEAENVIRDRQRDAGYIPGVFGRGPGTTTFDDPAFNSRPFTPAPKKGK
jgi:hypothetical protein